MSQWVRLWEDMPNDPKWRVIARNVMKRSETHETQCPVSEVISVFIHMIVNACQAGHEGRLEGWNDEVVAIAIDAETDRVRVIREEMEGLVLDGNSLKGWNKRQPKREDNSTKRVQAFREKRNAAKRTVTHGNAVVTQRNAPEEKRIDAEKKEDSSLRSESNASSLCSDAKPPRKKLDQEPVSKRPKNNQKQKPSPLEILQTALSEKTAFDVIAHRKAKRAPLTPRAAELLVAAFRDHGDAEAAAEAMIANGWTGFKPEWLRNDRAGPHRAKPSVQNPHLASYFNDHGLNPNGSLDNPGKTIDLTAAGVSTTTAGPIGAGGEQREDRLRSRALRVPKRG